MHSTINCINKFLENNNSSLRDALNKIDKNKNNANAEIISSKNSAVKVRVTKTNETLMIAKEVLKIAK